jgi:ubiquitin-conjugating enzyme E2 G1
LHSFESLFSNWYADLTRDDSSGFSVGLEDDNWFKWRVCFEGPPETLYEGGLFTAILTFPEDFPNSPPEMKFINEMWHPNGTTCAILFPPLVSDSSVLCLLTTCS